MLNKQIGWSVGRGLRLSYDYWYCYCRSSWHVQSYPKSPPLLSALQYSRPTVSLQYRVRIMVSVYRYVYRVIIEGAP